LTSSRSTGRPARKALYDQIDRVRGSGRVSNLFKAYAAFPEFALANFQRLMVNVGAAAKVWKKSA
jgi:hypothetical protein